MQKKVLVTWKTQSFILKAKLHLLTKAVLLHLTFFDCLVAGILHFFGQFRGWLKVLALARIHPVENYFHKRNRVPLSNYFSFSNMFFIWLFLANTWEKQKKKRESPRSFKRKKKLSSLVWGKSLAFCTCKRSCARGNDAISFPEPTCSLVSTKTQSSGIINKLVPRALVSFAFKI